MFEISSITFSRFDIEVDARAKLGEAAAVFQLLSPIWSRHASSQSIKPRLSARLYSRTCKTTVNVALLLHPNDHIWACHDVTM